MYRPTTQYSSGLLISRARVTDVSPENVFNEQDPIFRIDFKLGFISDGL